MKKALAMLVALCLLAVAATALAAEAPAEDPEETARLNDIFGQVDRWIGIGPEDDPLPEGKLVFAVYEDSRDKDPVTSIRYGVLFGGIPADRLAESLDEADTVVVLWPEYKHVGSYGAGNAYRCSTMVGYYDLKNERVLFSRTAAVTEPPKKVSDRENHYGRFEAYAVADEIGERLAAEPSE